MRGLLPGDEPFLASLDSDEVVMRHVNEGSLAPDRALRKAQSDVAMASYRLHSGKWLIELSDTGAPVGWIELVKYRGPSIDETGNDYLQIGYQLAPVYWRRGYASEAAATLTKYALETLRWPLVIAYTRPENDRSTRLLERLGFKEAGKCDDSVGQSCILYLLRAKDRKCG
jgi:RimJ/RimL family protein N-acetyltransferase